MSAADLISRGNTGADLSAFFAFVRQHERSLVLSQAQTDTPRIGEEGPLKDEKIRFSGTRTLGYSLSKEKRAPGEALKINADFMGLLGNASPLPQHYSRLALERLKHNDSALSDFIELFEHRLISLFYKAWAKYQLPLSAEQSGLAETDKITQLIKNFAGASITDSLPLFYAGHFARANRSQIQLENMLSEIIQANVTIKPLVGQWRGIELTDRCQIGKFGRNHRLGAGVLMGQRFWDIQSNVDINISNLSFQAFNGLAEGTDKFAAVEQLIYQYLPSHISVNLKLVVQSGQAQRPKLGGGFQLARNSWLGTRSTTPLTATRRLAR